MLLPIMGYGKTTICVRNKSGTKPLLKWKEVINPICSTETLLKLKAVLKCGKRAGSKLYSKDFSMAGKTGTAQ
jgi:cell division protein FtsI (penicillin-binding protein 3)